MSEEFREWFSSRVFGEPIYQSKIGSWHSLSYLDLGESDLVFLFEAIDGPRTVIHIENKINASPQPEQGNRYRFRGEKGQKDGYWENFKTCIIAPNKYLSSSKNSESYDIEVSYEEILAYFQSRRPLGERFSYKARILLEGIEQNRRGYQPEYNDAMTNFVADYYKYAADNYPQLYMQKAKPRPAGSTWIMFYPPNLNDKGINLVHQLTKGLVKIFFKGLSEEFEKLETKYNPILPENASIGLAGKSVAISIKVPPIEPLSKRFEEERDKVDIALNHLVLLLNLVTNNE